VTESVGNGEEARFPSHPGHETVPHHAGAAIAAGFRVPVWIETATRRAGPMFCARAANASGMNDSRDGSTGIWNQGPCERLG